MSKTRTLEATYATHADRFHAGAKKWEDMWKRAKAAVARTIGGEVDEHTHYVQIRDRASAMFRAVYGVDYHRSNG